MRSHPVRRRWQPSLLFLVPAILSGCGSHQESAADRPLDWTVTEIARLQAPDSAMTAIPWGVAADPATGRVYAVDPPNHRVLVFDREGGYVGEFGRSGEGPGEFGSPWSLALRPDGTLSVLDSRVGRIGRLSAAGEWLGSDPLPPSFFGPGHADLGDRLVMVTAPMTDDPLLLRQELSLVAGGDVSVIASTDQSQIEARLPCVARTLSVPKPIGPAPVWTTFGDTVLVASGPEYALDLYESGELVGRFERSVPPVQVTREMVVERIEAGELRILMRRCDIDAATVADGMDWSGAVSPLQRIAVAPDGRLWITRTGATLRSFDVDVLDRNGVYLGTVRDIPSPVSFLSPTRFVGAGLDRFSGTSLRIMEVSIR